MGPSASFQIWLRKFIDPIYEKWGSSLSPLEGHYSELASCGKGNIVGHQNGQGVRFWQDPRVPDFGVLSDHARGSISDYDWNRTVNSFSI